MIPLLVAMYFSSSTAQADELPQDIQVLMDAYHKERAKEEAEHLALLERARTTAAAYYELYSQQCEQARTAFRNGTLGWVLSEYLVTRPTKPPTLESLREGRNGYAWQVRVAEMEAQEAGPWRETMLRNLRGLTKEIDAAKTPSEGVTLRASSEPGPVLPTIGHPSRDLELGVEVDFPFDASLSVAFRDCEPFLFADVEK